MVLYKPWRRRVDARRNALRRDALGEAEEGEVLQELDFDGSDGQEHGEPELLGETVDEAALPGQTSSKLQACVQDGTYSKN